MLTFAGKLSAELILTYKDAILELFPKTFTLIRNDTLKKYMVHEVPCVRKANGTLPMAIELFEEFYHNNAHLRKWGSPEHPMWMRGTPLDRSKAETSFSFFLIDPNNTS